jgi:hypothetical protein
MSSTQATPCTLLRKNVTPMRQLVHSINVSHRCAAFSTTNTAPQCYIQDALSNVSLMAQPYPLHPSPPQILSTPTPTQIPTLYGPPRRAPGDCLQTCVERYPRKDLRPQPTSPRTPHFKPSELPTCDLLGKGFSCMWMGMQRR